MYVYFYPTHSKRKHELSEVHCQVGLRAEVRVLDTCGEENCSKEGAAGILPQKKKKKSTENKKTTIF